MKLDITAVVALLVINLCDEGSALIYMRCFLRKAYSTEQTPFMRVSPPGTHFSAESSEAMRIKYLAEGQDILLQLGYEPSIAVSRN